MLQVGWISYQLLLRSSTQGPMMRTCAPSGGTNDAAPGAFPETGDVANNDSPAECAARLVARNDLDMQTALAAVVRVQHVRVGVVGRGLEAHIAVGVLHRRLADRPLEGGAPTEHLQPVGAMYTIAGVRLAGAASNRVRLPRDASGRRHPGLTAPTTRESPCEAHSHDEAEQRP